MDITLMIMIILYGIASILLGFIICMIIHARDYDRGIEAGRAIASFELNIKKAHDWYRGYKAGMREAFRKLER